MLRNFLEGLRIQGGGVEKYSGGLRNFQGGLKFFFRGGGGVGDRVDIFSRGVGIFGRG